MTIQTNLHEVRSVNITRKGALPEANLDGSKVARTGIEIVNGDGEVYTLTLFHPVGDLPITISE